MKPRKEPARASKKPRALYTKPKPFARHDLEERVRKICLGLPDAYEKEAWGGPTFRARHGMFAMYVDNHHGDGELAVWCRAPKEIQEIVVGSDPKRFFVPPYVGVSGWIGIRLNVKVDWDKVTHLLKEGHAMASEKRARPRPTRRPQILAPLEQVGPGIREARFPRAPLYPRPRQF